MSYSVLLKHDDATIMVDLLFNYIVQKLRCLIENPPISVASDFKNINQETLETRVPEQPDQPFFMFSFL